jgi:hypothetical protein
MTQAKDKTLPLLDAAFHDLALDVAKSRERTEEELARYGVKLDSAVSRVSASAKASLAAAKRRGRKAAF